MRPLEPEILVVRQAKEDRVDVSTPLDVVYSDDDLRVIRMWHIASTPFGGRWFIRIDIYE